MRWVFTRRASHPNPRHLPLPSAFAHRPHLAYDRANKSRKAGRSANLTGSSTKAAVAGPRSVALIGPYGCGKCALFDALMTAAGAAVMRSGDSGKHAASTEVRLGQCSFLGDRWSI